MTKLRVITLPIVYCYKLNHSYTLNIIVSYANNAIFGFL